ncbi:MAG: [protein-PII] uridylyltransferase family protein [Planctomycetota bacterium]|jgi:glutamate-ammonia-ligase adenylyltransferase
MTSEKQDPVSALEVLAAASEVLPAWVAANPALETALARTAPHEPGEIEARVQAALAEGEPSFPQNVEPVLRAITLEIATLDLAHELDLETTTRGLSDLADAIIQGALATVWTRARARWPQLDKDPARGPLCVFALGKLGGRELNYSSDIDLVFAHDEAFDPGPGAPDRQSLFERLGQWLFTALGGEEARSGPFRTDLRLRPDGNSGWLCPSAGAMIRYYRSRGRTWERQAWIKARRVAGNEDLAARILSELSPFVYRPYLSVAAIADLRSMRERILFEPGSEANTGAPPPPRGFDLKRGRGGVRDVEFTVQFLALMHGHAHPGVRLGGTLPGLAALVRVGAIDPARATDLEAAYRFLRAAEHRVQLRRMRQTHEVPSAPAERARLAQTLSLPGDADALTAFDRALAEHTRRAHQGFLSIVESSLTFDPEGPGAEAAELVLDPSPPSEKVERVFAALGFHDTERAARDLRRLAAGSGGSRYLRPSPRSQAALAALAPRLLLELGREPEPAEALSRFERTVSSLGARSILFEWLQREPDALTIFVKLAAEGGVLCEGLWRSPGLMDDLLDRLLIGARPDVDSVLAEVGPGGTEALPAIHRSHLLYTGVRDLGRRLNLMGVVTELSDLAEASLRVMVETALERARARSGTEPDGARLLVLGLGKLGGREISYGSDLDIVAAYEGEGTTTKGSALSEFYLRAGQNLQRISDQTRLYEIDHRLRPFGRNTPLVVRAKALCAYYEDRAEVWECLAATKVRAVAGDLEAARALAERVLDIVYARTHKDLAEETRAMRERLLGSQRSALDLKRSAGGLLDIEFIIAYLKLAAHGEPHSVRAGGVVTSLAALRRARLLNATAYTDLLTAYEFLRRAESRLRLETGRSESNIPTAPHRLRALARRLGYDDGLSPAEKTFTQELRYHLTATRRWYDRLVTPSQEPNRPAS